VLVLADRYVTETRDPDAPRQLDLLGAALATVGLGLTVYALIEEEAPILFVAGGAALAAFLLVEARRAAPMVPLGLFRSRTFSATNGLTLLLYAALGGALFFVPFNLIQVQRYSPAAAGAALLPFVLLVSILSRAAGAWAGKVGPRPFLVGGPLLAGAGFLLLARPAMGGSYWSTFFPAIFVLGAGMGFTVAPLTTAVMGAVDARHAGVASGINNAVARTAGLLAVAALGALLVARFNGALDVALAPLSLDGPLTRAVDTQRVRLGGADLAGFPPALRAGLKAAFEGAYVTAFRALMFVCAGLAALAGGVGLAVVRQPPSARLT
jgi:Major Facilitator Superfamily